MVFRCMVMTQRGAEPRKVEAEDATSAAFAAWQQVYKRPDVLPEVVQVSATEFSVRTSFTDASTVFVYPKE